MAKELSKNPNHPKKGDRITVEPIRDEKDVKAIATLLKDNPRNHLLFVMGVNNGLRVGDLLKLKAKDLRYLKAGETLTIKEGKTGKPNVLAINKTVYKIFNFIHVFHLNCFLLCNLSLSFITFYLIITKLKQCLFL